MRKQICKNCTYYSAYYRQFDDCYAKLGHGHCSYHKKALTQFETCDNFKSNALREETRASDRLRSLERAITSINEIAQILKEKSNT